MKTLREYIEILDEIDRRGFLKGMGAAAVAGATGGLSKGAKADWEKEPDITDPMTDEVIKKWKNVSTDGKATLRFLTTTAKPNWMSKQLTLIKNSGSWIPSDGVGSTPDNGRIRIDSNPVMAIRFIYTGPTNIVGIADPRTNSFGTPAYESMLNELLTAQNKILIDATNIGGGILEFKPNVRENVQPDLSEEELEEASPDAVQRIEQLVRYK